MAQRRSNSLRCQTGKRHKNRRGTHTSVLHSHNAGFRITISKRIYTVEVIRGTAIPELAQVEYCVNGRRRITRFDTTGIEDVVVEWSIICNFRQVIDIISRHIVIEDRSNDTL